MVNIPGPQDKSLKVELWSSLTIQDVGENALRSITIVPHDAADPSAGKVSLAAPLAAALMGHRVGELVQVVVYGKARTICILSVIPCPTDPR